MDNARKAQQTLIVNHMLKHGTITGAEAYERYGIMSFTKRISEIRKEISVYDEWKHGTNRFGKPIRYKVYALDPKELIGID